MAWMNWITMMEDFINTAYIMNRTIKETLVILCAMIAVCCTKDENTKEYPPLVINAEMRGLDASAKAEMKYRYSVIWQKNDRIIVKGSAGSDTFTLQSGDGTANGVFRQDGSSVHFSGNVTAYYPISVVFGNDLIWPSNQTASSIIPMISSKKIGDGSAERFTFTSLGTVLQLVFSTTSTDVAIRSIQISDEEKSFSGKFNVIDGKAVIPTSEPNNGITVDFGTDGVPVGVSAKFFNIAIPSGKYNNLEIKMVSTDGRECVKHSTTMPEFINNTVARVTYNGEFVTPHHDPDINNYKPVPAEGYKIAAMWIELLSNAGQLQSKTTVANCLDKIQNAGFNAVILDVRPVSGYVLYKSDFIPRIPKVGSKTISQIDEAFDGDVVQYFINECHRRKMKISLSVSVMPLGNHNSSDGYLSAENIFSGSSNLKWNWCCHEWLPAALSPDHVTCRSNIAKNYSTGIFAFASPSNDNVHTYIINMVKEIVSKYQIDGLALDYLRYQNYNSDFSDAARQKFGEYIGHDNIQPGDIYTWSSGDISNPAGFTPSTYYNQWCEWKAHNIQTYVKDIEEEVHKIVPNVKVELWADGGYPKPDTGQNFANKDLTVNPVAQRFPEWWANTQAWWVTDSYMNTGFANYLNIFHCGAYRSIVWAKDSQDSQRDTDTVEGILRQDKELIAGSGCEMFGCLSANPGSPVIFNMAEACRMCLELTDGLTVFDYCHFSLHPEYWAQCKEGIVWWRYENEGIEL